MKPLILTPGFGDNAPTATLYYGQDVRDSLRLLPDDSVHMVCTSPPYFGLRDYGTGDSQIGLEPTFDEFVDALVEVFREIKRVLRPDGTLWVNLGDTYAGFHGDLRPQDIGLKPKDLMGIPWRVAFALQADGWYLRQDIIWNKPSCMPESVQDRCTKSHEYVFLLAHPDSKGRYYYDADAIREPHKADSIARVNRGHHRKGHKWEEGPGGHTLANDLTHALHEKGRNKRSVWSVNPKPYKGAHFATWPPDLVRPMILSGTSEKGCCSKCGAPLKRDLRTSGGRDWRKDKIVSKGIPGETSGEGGNKRGQSSASLSNTKSRVTHGWVPTCSCEGASIVPCTVLDPFSGSATTGMVALQEGRNYVGIDLNPDYLDLAQARIEGRKAPQKPDDDNESGHDIFDLFGGSQ